MSLYSPYKAIGFVCDANPFVMNRLGEEIFLTVSIGSSFQVFRFNKLISCLVSKTSIGNIACLQVAGHETFVAVNESIIVYDRSNIVRTYNEHAHKVTNLMCIGKNLISFDIQNNIKIIDLKQRSVISEMKLLQQAAVTAVVHPATYVNKVLVGFSNGQLELWNLNKKALIHSFQALSDHFADKNANGDAVPAICCIEQSPACDVVALGLGDGSVLLLNLKLDRLLFTFQQEGGAVTSLSFRTDVHADRFPYLASSSVDGRIHIWNLGRGGAQDADDGDDHGPSGGMRKLQCSLDEAHVGAVSRVAFLPGEPVMVSAGAADNSIRVWIFDSPDGSARLLRSREGHSGAPTRIRYYGGTTNVSMRDNADGMSCELVSAGGDGSLRLFNTAVESQNRELSQKPILKAMGLQRRNERLPLCVGFDFSETRQRDWGNLVSVHQGSANAYVWRFRHRVATDMVLRQSAWAANERKAAGDRRNHACAVAMSPCGHFCVVGHKGGALFKYNVQSGKPRGAYPRSGGAPEMKKGLAQQRARVPGNVLYEEARMHEDALLSAPGLAARPAAATDEVSVSEAGHRGEVTGLFVDMTNATLVSCALDGQLLFWDFASHACLHREALGVPQLLMQGFRDGNFVAVAGQDRVVRVYDMLTFRLTRRFGGHAQALTDLAFTPDGRRLLTSSSDSTLRVWDMPTGRCLSWLRFSSPVLSMAVSLSGEFLCVAQADKEGLYLYVDKSLYETVHFWREPLHPTLMADSAVVQDQSEQQGADVSEAEDSATQDLAVVDIGTAVAPSQAQVVTGFESETAAQRGEGAITLSAVPRAYWTSLFHLEILKKRNKPVVPPAPAPLAPFFLPTIVRGGSTPSFPTPAEYARLAQSIQGDSAAPAAGAEPKRTALSAGLSEAEPFGKRAKQPQKELSSAASGGPAQTEEELLRELAAMGSAWTDDDGADFAGTAAWTVDRSTSVAVVPDQEPAKLPATSEATKSARAESRLIGKRTALPRCKMAAYLPQEDRAVQGEQALLLDYLKLLAPPAVDLEVRALCPHAQDEEGVGLLASWLRWLTRRVRSGDCFEILQAYVHRTLSIYSELLLQLPQLAVEVRELQAACSPSSDRFRGMVQKNLCLLKMMANIPIA